MLGVCRNVEAQANGVAILIFVNGIDLVVLVGRKTAQHILFRRGRRDALIRTNRLMLID